MTLMNKSFIVAFMLLLSSPAWAEDICDGAKPQTLAELKAENSEFPERQSQSIQFDLDGDGEKEFFESAGCGTGHCNFVVHKKNLNNHAVFDCVGRLDIHPQSFELLQTKHHGYPDILAYYHSNAETGRLSRLEFDGHEYHEVQGISGKGNLFKLIRPSYNGP